MELLASVPLSVVVAIVAGLLIAVLLLRKRGDQGSSKGGSAPSASHAATNGALVRWDGECGARCSCRATGSPA